MDANTRVVSEEEPFARVSERWADPNDKNDFLYPSPLI